MDAPVDDAPDAESVLLAEFVKVEVMNKVLTAVPSELATDCVTTVVVCGATEVVELSDVGVTEELLVVSDEIEEDVSDEVVEVVVGSEVVVAEVASVVAGADVVVGAAVVVSESVVCVTEADVVSATEVEVGSAVVLVSVLVGEVAGSDVVAAAEVVAAAAALVLSAEVILLDIVKTCESKRLELFLTGGAMLAKMIDNNVIYREAS